MNENRNATAPATGCEEARRNGRGACAMALLDLAVVAAALALVGIVDLIFAFLWPAPDPNFIGHGAIFAAIVLAVGGLAGVLVLAFSSWGLVLAARGGLLATRVGDCAARRDCAAGALALVLPPLLYLVLPIALRPFPAGPVAYVLLFGAMLACYVPAAVVVLAARRVAHPGEVA